MKQLVFSLFLKGNVHGELYTENSTRWTVRSDLYTVNCSVYMVNCTVYMVNCTQWTVHGELYTVNCTRRDVHGELYTVNCTRWTVRRELYIHSVLYTLYCTQSSVLLMSIFCSARFRLVSLISSGFLLISSGQGLFFFCVSLADNWLWLVQRWPMVMVGTALPISGDWFTD